MSIQTQVLYGNRLDGQTTYSDNNDPQTFNANLSDSTSLTDADTTTGTKPLTDTETLSEAIANLVQRAFTDSNIMTDARVLEVIQTFAESQASSDSRLFTPAKSLTDMIALTQTWTTQGTKVLLDSSSMIEAFAKAVYWTFAENETMTDARTIMATKVLSESLGSTDSRSLSASKTLADATSMADTFAKNIARAFTDMVVTSDSFAILANWASNETLMLSETTAKTVHKIFSEIPTSSLVLYARPLYGTVTSSSNYTDISLVLLDQITIEILQSLGDVITVADQSVAIQQTKGFLDSILIQSWLRLDLQRANPWTSKTASPLIQTTLTLYDNTLYGGVRLYAATPLTTWINGSSNKEAWTNTDEQNNNQDS